MANIKDVAKYCKVSVSTVSYALNDNPQLPIETRDRIKKAAAELNYVPNAYAKGLKKQKTHNIGIFITGFEGPVHHIVLSGIAQVLQSPDVNYNMIVTIVDDKLNLIKERVVDLAIIMDSKITDEVMKVLANIMPIVTFDKITVADNIYNTYIDNQTGIGQLVSHFFDLGRKRIAYMLGSNESFHNHDRFAGYKNKINQLGVNFNADLIYDAGSFTEEAGYICMRDNLKKSNILPFDSIICGNDELAIGTMRAIKEAGYQMPNDLLIAGFDNIEKSSLCEPSLTTINVDWFGYGRMLAELALGILNNNDISDKTILPVEMIVRNSSKG